MGMATLWGCQVLHGSLHGDKYYYMQNNQNPAASKCQKHCFSIKATHKQRRPCLNATLSMCLPSQSKKKKKQKNCATLDAPIFNQDRCHATPTFILNSEKKDYQTNTSELIRDHERRVREYEEQIDELYIPKPRSKNLYCNACRAHYSEYIDHILSVEHKTHIRESLFNTYILDLQKKFKTRNNRQISLASNEVPTGVPTEDDQVEIIGVRGSKKIKPNKGEENHAIAYLSTEGNAINPANPFHASSPAFFFSPQTFSQSLKMMETMGSCRNFYGGFNSMSFNPYFSYATENQMALNCPFYYMPYSPMLNFDLYKQH